MEENLNLPVTEFNSEEFQNAYPDGINSHYWNKARNYIILNNLKRHGLKYNPVLEVGCGRGGVVAFLKNKHIDILGIELASCKPFKEAEKDIITGKDALEMDALFKEKFKTILLLDVIEHLESPFDFMKELLNAYTNVQQLIITVPARQEVWSNYDEFYGHFRRYNLEMTKQTIEKLGFTIQENRYFFHSLYLPASVLAKKGKNRNLKISAPKSTFQKSIHAILAAGFKNEYYILPQNWKGTSIFCSAIRKEQ